MKRPTTSQRIVPRDGGRPALRRIGFRHRYWADLYHFLLRVSWPRLLGLMVLLYLGVNSLFACVYYFDAGGVENARPGSYADAFFFSVQTLATIGYGKMAPVSTLAHVTVATQALAGMMLIAVGTGLVFAKFSRPVARLQWSRVATIARRDGVPCLALRVANERASEIVEAQMRVAIAKSERTQEGESVRRFYDLPLQRSVNLIFPLTWTVIHTITPDSPLHGATTAELVAWRAEIVCSLTGIDGASSQTVHARFSYVPDEVRFDERFVVIISRDEDGGAVIDHRRFHDTHPQP